MVALLNYFYRVDITVITYVSGSTSTKTYSFVNKALKDSSTITTYWPILKSVGETSVAEGETLPNVSLSAIEIDNTIGSFGPNRKFSDVLERYSCTEQSVVLYIGQVSTSSDSVGSWTQIAQGVVDSYEANAAGNEDTLQFAIRPNKYSEKVLNLEINRSVSGMSGAPASSLGRAVPLLIGDNLDLLPVRITADGTTTATKWAVGTCFYQFLENDSISAHVYTKNGLDAWEIISNGSTDYSGAASAGTRTLNTYSAVAYGTNLNASALITGVQLRAKGNGSGGRVSTAFLTVTLHKGTINKISEEVARGVIALNAYDASNNAGTANFAVNVSFNNPVFLSYTTSDYYYIGYSVTGYAVNELSLHYASSFSRAYFIKDPTSTATYDSPDEFRFAGFSTNPLCYKLLEVAFTFTDYVSAFTNTGLTYSMLTGTQFTPDSGQVNPSLDNLPILVGGMTGLMAYGGGGTVYERPQVLVDLLAYNWNGSTNTWADSLSWDSTELNTSHYEYLYDGGTMNFRTRSLRGVFENKVSFSQFVSEVCRCSASKVGVLSTGKSFLYPWGMTVTPVRDIPYADITALSWEQGNISTVVNRAVIKTGRSWLYAPRTFETQDSVGYQYVTDFSSTNFVQVAAMTAESRALYGVKDLENGEFILWPRSSLSMGGYLGDSNSQGSIIGEYYLGRFGKPITQCSFIVPYSRYSDLRMFNVITFTSVKFPAFYGTDPNARDGTVDVGGAVSTVSTADSGYETVRAKTYRGLITGVSTVLAMEHAPVMKLTVQVLTNSPYDPT